MRIQILTLVPAAGVLSTAMLLNLASGVEPSWDDREASSIVFQVGAQSTTGNRARYPDLQATLVQWRQDDSPRPRIVSRPQDRTRAEGARTQLTPVQTDPVSVVTPSTPDGLVQTNAVACAAPPPAVFASVQGSVNGGQPSNCSTLQWLNNNTSVPDRCSVQSGSVSGNTGPVGTSCSAVGGQNATYCSTGNGDQSKRNVKCSVNGVTGGGNACSTQPNAMGGSTCSTQSDKTGNDNSTCSVSGGQGSQCSTGQNANTTCSTAQQGGISNPGTGTGFCSVQNLGGGGGGQAGGTCSATASVQATFCSVTASSKANDFCSVETNLNKGAQCTVLGANQQGGTCSVQPGSPAGSQCSVRGTPYDNSGTCYIPN